MKHTNFFSALKSAVEGVFCLFSESRNARIQAVIFLLVVIIGYAVELKKWEWIWVIFSACLVLILEAINTSIELLADLITMERHPKIKSLKDISAAAVLMASLCSICVGITIFYPHIKLIFQFIR